MEKFAEAVLSADRGPDLVVFWNSGEIFYDFTVIHELAPSNLGTKCGKLFRDAIKRKQDTYVRSGLISEETFRCVPVLSGGVSTRKYKISSQRPSRRLLPASKTDADGVSTLSSRVKSDSESTKAKHSRRHFSCEIL